MSKLRELARRPGLFTGGHRLCAGCGAPVLVRQVLAAADRPLVVANGTGCLQVASAIYPYTAWRTPWIHNAFANTAATLSGAEAAYRALRRQGRIDSEIGFVAFAGDGGTYDIGLQSLSGALERRHKILYICYDNEGYMNTGIQRSSSTPLGADTTTTPVGERSWGKDLPRKDMVAVVAAHGVPYVAQTTPAHWHDLVRKTRHALNVDGPSFLNVYAPCPRGWRSQTGEGMELCRLAADTCYWPVFEVEEGRWRLNYRPKVKKPVADFLRGQGRFKHLFEPGNRHVLERIQAAVDRRWEELLARCGIDEQTGGTDG